MAFDRNNIKFNYSTDEDNVLSDFYIPVLSESVSYDRAVGYFSSQGLLKYLQGVDGLIRNNGRMRLLIGDTLSDDEYFAVKNSEDYRDVFRRLDESWSEVFNEDVSDLGRYRLQIFSWLFNRGFLEIRYAFRRRGLFHKKIGIARDSDGAVIAFSGSMNETNHALISNRDNPDGNSEEFSVYPSWEEGIFESFGRQKVEAFDKVWDSREANTITVKLPSNQYESIRNIYTSREPPLGGNFERQQQAQLFDNIVDPEFQEDEELDFSYPRVPKFIGGRKYETRNHQIKALKKWQENDYQGIMALATGAGKTITSIYGVVRVSEGARVVLVVSVPYQVLADQWCSVLELFNIKAIRCYNSRSQWEPELTTNIGNFALGISDFFAAVVVNATLAKNNFLSAIGQIPEENLFFIGDECHHHGGENLASRLPQARYKIGLSATPWSTSEVENRARLEGYYGPIVASYTMQDALNDDILTGYKYFIYPVSMNEDEGELYEQLSRQISGLYNKDKRTASEDQMLSNLIFKRSRLLDSLENKFETLEAVLNGRLTSKHTLFYCGSGSSIFSDEDFDDTSSEKTKSIDRVTEILYKNNWNISKFTAEESHRERESILNNFKLGSIDAIAAIRVLDEGFDVPMCREAYITASSRNERQFIQRRGRILRKSPGKKEAIIHDFVIVPDSQDAAYKALLTSELVRVREFYSVANNKGDIYEKVAQIIEKHDLNFDLDEVAEDG